MVHRHTGAVLVVHHLSCKFWTHALFCLLTRLQEKAEFGTFQRSGLASDRAGTGMTSLFLGSQIPIILLSKQNSLRMVQDLPQCNNPPFYALLTISLGFSVIHQHILHPQSAPDEIIWLDTGI